ncbi:MAG: hypothetical protein EBU29_06480 [Gammaproteobacteria bacterium]|nr:hypothetical protein [Gammaproteobacteria bacterium]
MPSILRHLSLLVLALALAPAYGQIAQTKNDFEDKFRQLDESWPTPTATRSATGAPGPAYWQQQVDYDIDVHLLEEGRRIEGEARIRYHNNSPEALAYLWFQMDQNRFRPDSDDSLTRTFGEKDRITYRTLRREQFMESPSPRARKRKSAFSGPSTSKKRTPPAAGPALSTSQKTATTSSCWLSGIRGWRLSPITRAGTTRPSSETGSSPWSSVTTKSPLRCPRTTLWPPRACFRIPGTS